MKSRPKLCLEALEERSVLAAASFSEGVLTITGTDGSDLIRIWQDSDQLIVDGASFQISASLVERIEASLAGGNDNLTNETLIPLIAHGGEGDDRLIGGGGDDLLFGDSGIDDLIGGEGADVLSGGGQLKDRLEGGRGGDVLEGQTQIDKVDWGLSENPYFLRLYGTEQDDRLLLSRDADAWAINGLTLPWAVSNLRVDGMGGDDLIFNTTSFDGLKMWGNDGRDRLIGGRGADFLDGGSGSDVLFGRHGSDVYQVTSATAGFERDVIIESLDGGEDQIQFPQISGATVHTFIDASGLRGTVEQPSRLLRLFGAAAEIIVGGSGNDTIIGGPFVKQIHGSNGNDTLHVGDGSALLFGGPGDDRLDGSSRSDTLDGGDGADQLFGHGGDDLLRGASGADHLRGGAGDDSLYGDGDDDYLSGDEGNDALAGGIGNDAYAFSDTHSDAEVDSIDDSDMHNAFFVNYDMQIDLAEPVFLHRHRIINREGAGFSTFSGGQGHHSILGTSGADTIKVTATWGSYYIDGREGDDIIASGGSASQVHGGAGNDTITGGYYDDTIWGDDGDDVIDGGDGRDTIQGGSGNDVIRGEGVLRFSTSSMISYVASAFSDLLIGGDGDDVINGQLGNDRIEGNDGNDTIYGGWDSDELFGDSGNDQLNGGEAPPRDNFHHYHGRSAAMDGNDVLHGGEGNDALDGAIGVDQLFGDDGDDLLEADEEDSAFP